MAQRAFAACHPGEAYSAMHHHILVSSDFPAHKSRIAETRVPWSTRRGTGAGRDPATEARPRQVMWRVLITVQSKMFPRSSRNRYSEDLGRLKYTPNRCNGPLGHSTGIPFGGSSIRYGPGRGARLEDENSAHNRRNRRNEP